MAPILIESRLVLFGSCYTFDMRKMAKPLNVHMDHTEAVMDLAYSPTGREFVSGSYDRSIRIFPLDKGRSRFPVPPLPA